MEGAPHPFSWSEGCGGGRRRPLSVWKGDSRGSSTGPGALERGGVGHRAGRARSALRPVDVAALEVRGAAAGGSRTRALE